MATNVGQLVFEMSANVARLQSDMQKARGHVDSAMDSIRNAASIAKGALAAVGMGLSIESFASMIKGSIDAMNAMHELALKTGQTVEALSSLQPVARRSGTDMEQLATGLQKLSKNMLEAAETGKGKASAAFQALGVELVDTSGKLRDNVSVMQEVAEKLDAMENKTQAVALAQLIFGKAGAQLLPFLHELSAAGELHARITTQQAEAAHHFHSQLTELTNRSEALKFTMATGLLPALSQIVGAFTDLAGKGTDATSFFQTVGVLLKWVAEGAMSFWLALKDMGDSLGAMAAQAAALLSGNLEAFRAIGRERDAQAKKNEEEFEAFKKRMSEMPEIVAKAKETSTVTGAAETGAVSAAGTGAGAAGGGARFVAAVFGDGAAGIPAATAAAKEFNEQLVETKRSGEDIGTVLESAAMKSIRQFKDLKSALREVLAELIKVGAQQISKSLGGGGGFPDLGGAISSFFGGGMATGGDVAGGTSYLVGEGGPELFTPGSSGSITPNGALGGDTYNIDARGADAGGLARLEAMIRSLNGSIEHRAVGAVQRAWNRRGVSTPVG